MKSILAKMLALDGGLLLPSQREGKACLLPAYNPFLSTVSAGALLGDAPRLPTAGSHGGEEGWKCSHQVSWVSMKPIPKSSTELSQVPAFPKFTVYLWIKAVLAEPRGVSSTLPRPDLAMAPVQIQNGWGLLDGGGGFWRIWIIC